MSVFVLMCICLCMLWYNYLVSTPKLSVFLCASTHPHAICECIYIYAEEHTSAHKHMQAPRNPSYMCAILCAHSQGSLLSCPPTFAVSISPCPTQGSWPGFRLREKESRAVVCGGPINTLP